MPTLLETQGKVRKAPAIAWAVWIPDSPRDHSWSTIMAGGDEILIDYTTRKEVKDKDGKVTHYVSVSESRWEPERYQRMWIRYVPEAIHQADDLEKIRAAGNFVIFDTLKQRDSWIAKRKIEAEKEFELARAKRREADERFLREQAEESAKVRGES